MSFSQKLRLINLQLNKYKKSNPGSRSKKIQQVTKAGLNIPPIRARHIMENILPKNMRINKTAPVYLAAILEYITILNNLTADYTEKQIKFYDWV